jgi:hypothetical protein
MGHPKNRVTIKRDRDWGEYIVRTYRGGKLVGTYHTDDKKDAQGTAAFIRRDEHSKGFMNPKRKKFKHDGRSYTAAQLRRRLRGYRVSKSYLYSGLNSCSRKKKRNGSHYKFGRKHAKHLIGLERRGKYRKLSRREAEKVIRRGSYQKRRRRRAASHRASGLIGPTDRKHFAKHGRFRSTRRKMLYRKLTQLLNGKKRGLASKFLTSKKGKAFVKRIKVRLRKMKYGR